MSRNISPKAIVAATAVVLGACVVSPSVGWAQTPRLPGSAQEMEAIYEARTDSARWRFSAADVEFVSSMMHHHAQAITIARMAPTHGASPTLQTLAARIINSQHDEIATMGRWLEDRGQPVPQLESSGGDRGDGPGSATEMGHEMGPGIVPGQGGGMDRGNQMGEMGHGMGAGAGIDMTDHAEHTVADHAEHMASNHAEHTAADHAEHMASDHAEHIASGQHPHASDAGSNSASETATDPEASGHSHVAGTEAAVHDHTTMAGMLSPEQIATLDAARGQEFDRLFLAMMIFHHRGAVTMVEDLFASDDALQDVALYKLATDIQAEQTTEIDRMTRMLTEMTGSPLGPALLEIR